jgi:peptidoglycan hydrolase CwlO-like protein
MSEPWLYGLLASLILLAIGTSLKSAHDAFMLKQSDKEVARLESEIDTLNKTHNETISTIQQSNSAEITKLNEKISQLEKTIEFHSKKPIVYPSSGGGSNSWMA